jgi:hypothetical protein
VKKNEIWWPSRASPDPFPADVDRVDSAGVKLLGVPIGTKAFTTDFVQKKLDALNAVYKLLKELAMLRSSSRFFEVVWRTTRSIICCARVPLACSRKLW